jgi:hypothetical protein
MRYESEEIRHAFHKADTMLQVICAVLENYFYSFGQQLDVIEVQDDERSCAAIVVCKGMDGRNEANLEAARLLNTQFKRKDDLMTCVCEDPRKAIFLIYVTHPGDLAHLQ